MVAGATPVGGELSDALLAEGRAAWGQGGAGESDADRRDRIERAMRDAEKQRDRLLDQLTRQAEALAASRRLH